MRVRLFSNSELKTFKRCRRKWYFGYHLGLTAREPWTGPLAIGTRMHIALAAMYDPSNPRDPAEVLEELIAADAAKNDDPSDEELKDFNKEADLCRAMIEGYVEWLAETGADEFYEPLGAEELVEAEFPVHDADDVPVRIVGRLDQKIRRKDDGALMFLDHKTVGTFKVPWLELDEQMLMYHLLQKLMHPDEPVVAGGVYNMMRKVKRTANAKPPFYERLVITHNETELRNFWVRLAGTITDVLAVESKLDEGEDHRFVAYPNPNRDCNWDCEFFHACTMTDDGSRVEEMMSAYRVIDAYERRYADAGVVTDETS